MSSNNNSDNSNLFYELFSQAGQEVLAQLCSQQLPPRVESQQSLLEPVSISATLPSRPTLAFQAQNLNQLRDALGIETSPIRDPQKLSERHEFLLCIKMLFHILKKNKANDRLRLLRAKAVIAECTHRNRIGDESYFNLQRAVEARLRRTVGEDYWTEAKDRVHDYCRRKGMMRQTAISAV